MNDKARKLWQEKLDFLLVEEAKAVDPAAKFQLTQHIAEARARLVELDEFTGADVEPLVSSTRLLHTAPRLFGRDEELAILDRAWEDERTNIVCIVSWGGTGKTSLVAEWMSLLAADDWRGAARVFDWSFYRQGTRRAGRGGKQASADVFIAKALQFFGDPDPQQGSLLDRGARLARRVGLTKSLLVLDGLEPLQHPPGALAGTLTDPALAALLKGLAWKNAGLCVLTTRETLSDLAVFAGPGKTVLEWRLDRLSNKAGAALLRSLGVVGLERELEAAAHEVAGHALTLQLMGRYLALAHEGDIRRRDLFEYTHADAEVQGGHAFRVLAAYERWLSGYTENQRLLALLRLMGFFDRPADPGCLAALRDEPVIAGLTEPLVRLSTAQWNIAVKRLKELGLLSHLPFEPTVVQGYGEEIARPALARSQRGHAMNLPKPQPFTLRGELWGESLDAHPLLREYFADQVREQSPVAWQAGHRRLFEHLSGSVPYWPEGVDGLQPLYQAVFHGCLSGLHEKARADVYRDRILRGTGRDGMYSTYQLGAIGEDLGALTCFFPTPWTTPGPNLSPSNQAWLLNEAAYRLRALGRLTEAIEPMQAGLEMRIEQGVWKSAAMVACNLSGLELTRGEVSAAVTIGEQAVTYANQSKEEFEQLAARTTLADALTQAGRRDEAWRLFEDAESRQAADQPEYHSLWGFRYSDFLLAAAERTAWQHWLSGEAEPREMAMTAIAICDAVSARTAKMLVYSIKYQAASLVTSALDHLTLARAALYKLHFADAIPHFEFDHVTSAVDGLRASGMMDDLPRGLLTRAWLRLLSGDEAGCRADLNEAWEVAEQGPMPLFQADIQFTRARLFRDHAALAEARRLIQKHGYHRRDGELADALKTAKDW